MNSTKEEFEELVKLLEAIFNLAKEIIKEFFKDEELPVLMAEHYSKYFNELIKRGFSREEALQIILETRNNLSNLIKKFSESLKGGGKG